MAFGHLILAFFYAAVLCRVAEARSAAVERAAQRPSWDEAYAQAADLVRQMSLEEKIGLTNGQGFLGGPVCEGVLNEVPRLGIPPLCFQDGSTGVRGGTGGIGASGKPTGPASGFPAGVNAGATWDRALIRERGRALGEEMKSAGVNFWLGPSVNSFRSPESGRAWEGFSIDPFLSGEAAYETISGAQETGVAAMVKHLVGNEQERNRFTSSSNIDSKTLHEIYLPPFQRAIDADVASVMCSYNRLNGTYACENKALLDELRAMGHRGPVVSDWGATHSLASVDAGLDVEMPGGFFFNGGGIYGPVLQLKTAIGAVNASRVDLFVQRTLAAWIHMGQRADKSYPNLTHHGDDVRGNHADVIRRVGAASTVLLRNEGGALPLNLGSIKKVALIGTGARSNPDGVSACPDQSCNKGFLVSGWGSGSAIPISAVAPLDAFKAQAPQIQLATSFSDSDLTAAAKAASGADAAIVFVSAHSGESFPPYIVEGSFGDRNDLNVWHNGDALVDAVARANKNVIVVVNSPGHVNMAAWFDKVKAVLWYGYPGDQGGSALLDVLSGKENPRGRLPFTLAKSPNDFPSHVAPPSQQDIPYNEGVFVDYRHFDQANIAPLREFGFGLSYTKFDYTGLQITPKGDGATISFDLKNTGARAGIEVPQLYLGFPTSAAQPPKVLRGFDAIGLKPGESKRVTFSVDSTGTRYWQNGWKQARGQFSLYVGASSRDIRLNAKFTL